MVSLALALWLGAAPLAPRLPGVYRRAVAAADGVHLATYIYVPERRRPHAPTVVLLPDLGATHLFFDQDGAGLARSLMARGYRVATLDWRGTGLSESPPVPASIEDLATRDVPAVLDILEDGSEPMVLVGWGFGGSIAYAVAASPNRRGRVSGVVALDGVVELDVPNAHFAHLLEAAGEPVDLSLALGQRAPHGTDDLFGLLWLHGGTWTRSTHLMLLAHGLGVISPRQVDDLRAWMASGKTTIGGSFPEEVGQVRCPVLAIQGLLDNWTHPEFASAVSDHLPGSQVTLYTADRLTGFSADLGHVGLVLGSTAEREVFPLIFAFLARLSAPAGEVTP